MKPKTRVFCPACHRQKMVFETKKEAEMFMMYNSDDIENEHGYKPIRAYYCQSCMGWHITSQEKISLDYNSVISIVSQFGNPVAIFPGEDDVPDNPCINKSRKKVYTAILAIRDIVDKTPDTIEEDLLLGMAGAKGYIKLAERENNIAYMYDAEACKEYLCMLLIQTISKNLQRLSMITDNDDVCMEATERHILNQTYNYTGVLHNFSGYVDTSLELKAKVDEESSRIHKRYQEIMVETKSERAIKKLNEYIKNVEDFVAEDNYEAASKFIHFAVMLIQKVADDEEIRDTLKMFINKLIEYKSIVDSNC